jgi:hypothetical protein
MYNKKPNSPPIYALALLGPRAMQVIDRHKSTPAIGAYEMTLGPKVGRFKEVHHELKQLVVTYKRQADLSAAAIEALEVTTRDWDAHLQVDTSYDSEDIAITETRTPDASLANATSVMALYREHGELPYAAQALSDLEEKSSNAKAAYDAQQAGRVAVQEKQRELQSIAAGVQAELVKLRRALRRLLGSSHFDYQRLRVSTARADADVPDETTPVTAEGSTSPVDTKP